MKTRRLDLFQMNFLIRIDENTRTDVIGKEDVRNRMVLVGTLEGRVDLRVLRGFGWKTTENGNESDVIAPRLSARPR